MGLTIPYAANGIVQLVFIKVDHNFLRGIVARGKSYVDFVNKLGNLSNSIFREIL